MQTLQEMLMDEQENLGSYLVRQTKKFLELAQHEEEIQNGLSVIGAKADKKGHTCYAYISGGDNVWCYVNGLTSFAQVGEYLRDVKAVVFERIENRKREELNYQCSVGKLRLVFSVNGQGATCRKVQVGTETREVPIYKVVCDGKDNVDEGELS